MLTVQRGWSLVELLVVMAVAVAVSLMVVPSFHAMFHRLQVRTAVDEWVSWMAMARSEAIKRRHGRVVICIASSQVRCDEQGDWQNGWLMFHDLNGNARLDAEDTVIRYGAARTPRLRAWGNTHVRRYVSYVSSGRTLLVSGALQVGTWSFCHRDSATVGWQVVLSATGRARVAPWEPVGC